MLAGSKFTPRLSRLTSVDVLPQQEGGLLPRLQVEPLLVGPQGVADALDGRYHLGVLRAAPVLGDVADVAGDIGAAEGAGELRAAQSVLDAGLPGLRGQEATVRCTAATSS